MNLVIRPEEAKAALKQFEVENARQRLAASLARCSEQPRSLGEELLDISFEMSYWHKLHGKRAAKAWDEYLAKLDTMSDTTRGELFACFFPKLASQVENAWQLLHRMPYVRGHCRKPFRAPHAPEMTRTRRFFWLKSAVRTLSRYDQDIRWWAAWGTHALAQTSSDNCLDVLLAAALDGGSKDAAEVSDILRATAEGSHQIGAMGTHIIRAFLMSSAPELWDYVGNLLLAAQRQEGLRQSILEAVDESHPDAFPRFLRTILDQDMLRFSATVRAVDVWFGFGWDSEGAKGLEPCLRRVLTFLEDDTERRNALKQGNGEAAYLALWAGGFRDIVPAMGEVRALLSDPDPGRRLAAVLMAAHSLLGNEFLLQALHDPDWRVAIAALRAVDFKATSVAARESAFADMEALLALSKQGFGESKPLVWPWVKPVLDRDFILSRMVECAQDVFSKRLIPYLKEMDAERRALTVNGLAKSSNDEDVRTLLLGFLGDRSPYVRDAARRALNDVKLRPAEAPLLEGMLTSKVGDLRKEVLALLLAQSDEAAMKSSTRLLALKNAQQREAGAELLRKLVEQERVDDTGKLFVESQVRAQDEASDEERRHYEAISSMPAQQYTLDDALGLIDVGQLTTPEAPQNREVSFDFACAADNLKALDAFIHENREKLIVYRDSCGDEQELLLGEMGFRFPGPGRLLRHSNTDSVDLPEREMWGSWFETRDPKLYDTNRMEWLQASILMSATEETREGLPEWIYGMREQVLGPFANYLGLRYPQMVSTLCRWFICLYPPAEAPVRMLDAFETLLWQTLSGRFAELGERQMLELVTNRHSPAAVYLDTTRLFRALSPDLWSQEERARLASLIYSMHMTALPTIERNMQEKPESHNTLYWFAGPVFEPRLEELVDAYERTVLNDIDMIHVLLTPSQARYAGYGQRGCFTHLRELSGRKPGRFCTRVPRLSALVERCRERILSIELARGDLPTAASPAARCLRYIRGVEEVVALLRAMGKSPLVRGAGVDDSKPEVLSHLLRVAYPREDDTPAQLAQLAGEAKISQEQLIELALFAPQWAHFVEAALQMPGLEEGVWWIHAHTKDDQWGVDTDVREQWAAEVTERTPLSAQDLLDGAVDVEWFQRVQEVLGEEGWLRTHGAARFASRSSGHKRAQLFADAMLGRVKVADIMPRIEHKRHQDSVLALGLIPVARGTARNKDLLARYEALQEFLRTSRQFGAQRQESEKRAVEVGMENLARTAGYADPARLQWAMERTAVADLAKGPVSAQAENVTVALSIDGTGQPRIAVTKAGKSLNDIPPKAKKDVRVRELTSRVAVLRRQSSRMRFSLEQAMCRGERFTGKELREFADHPLLVPMLRNLVFVNDNLAGYWGDGGTLHGLDGNRQAIGNSEEVRIAHPYDLLNSGQWSRWQQDCLACEHVQPFKQVFRELYPLTQTEKDDRLHSARYAGHQVNPRQALALLGQRGWVSRPEEGVRRTFHRLGFSVWLEFTEPYFTPAEVEGFTVENVVFRKIGDSAPIPLVDIPAPAFSEVMRDIDLVVSVAHRGGVDPEASASTVEMRAALLQETCRLLKMDNVRIDGKYALVHGELADYSLHLGSASVQMLPGGSLVIVPIHAQHRGRLFLPFVDDDPRTAEVISKCLLLARDSAIKDPNVLEQIRRRA